MPTEEKKRVELLELPDDVEFTLETADFVKGGAQAPGKKVILFFDEADSLFGRKRKDK